MRSSRKGSRPQTDRKTGLAPCPALRAGAAILALVCAGAAQAPPAPGPAAGAAPQFVNVAREAGLTR
ncbi:MAG TPA: hypothetical protein VN898_03540, partial [Candidatus Binatia bacterium]|nr:hypothetical protein [Candidatus Binatia bacterium]